MDTLMEACLRLEHLKETVDDTQEKARQCVIPLTACCLAADWVFSDNMAGSEPTLWWEFCERLAYDHGGDVSGWPSLSVYCE